MHERTEKLLLFDVDGVIVDSFEPLYQDISAYVKHKTGLTVSRDRYRGLFEGNALQKVLRLAGKKSTDDFNEEDRKMFFASYHQTVIFPGMKEVLQKLAEQHTLVVVTSTLTTVVTEKFNQEGIGDLFAAYLGSETAIHKDEKINMALQEFGFTPAETWFVTDTSGDIKEAKKTKIHTIAASWGYHDETTLRKAEPDHLVQTPAQLLETLQG